jgi:hypothetical protein
MGEIQNANSIYDYTRNSQSTYSQTKPSQTFAEELVSAKLLANSQADAQDRRPPVPNIGVIAPRYGYRTEPATIEDILNVDENFPAKFGDWSGTVSGYEGTSYPNITSQL